MSEEIRLQAEENWRRLDSFLAHQLSEISRSKVEKLIKNGLVELNGKITKLKKHPVQAGDIILIKVIDQPQPTIDQKLNKVYEDEYLLVIEKPAGIAVHPGSGERELTILDIFRAEYPQLADFKDQQRPGIVHRLDKETTGLLLLAKKEHIQLKLQKQFRQRKIIKKYLAIVEGEVEARFANLQHYIERHPRNPNLFIARRQPQAEKSRLSELSFRLLVRKNGFSLLQIMPLTGRTHQIRVQLAAYGHPVLGDKFYNPQSKFETSFLALHAYFLSFIHPQYKERLSLRSYLPSFWHDFWRKEKI